MQQLFPPLSRGLALRFDLTIVRLWGVDGSKVSKMIDQGKIQEVRDYCETDILNTYLVYLRFMMHRGDIDLDGYKRGVSDVITMIEAKRNKLPY